MNLINKAIAFLRHYVGGFFTRALSDHVFLQASGLAFSVIICILPLVLVLFSVLGALLETPEIAARVNSFLDLAIPYPEYAVVVKRFVFERVGEFRFYKSVTAPVGLAGLFLAASGLFSSIRTVMHQVFRIENSPWAFLAKFRDLGLVFLVLVYFLLIAAVMPVSEYLAAIARDTPFLGEAEAAVLSRGIIRFATYLFLLIAFLLLFRFVPSKKLPGSVIFVSAVTTTFFWFVAQTFFKVYITHAVTLQEVYGAYLVGTAAVLWIYAGSGVLIMGAVVGQLYRERREVELEAGDESPSEPSEEAERELGSTHGDPRPGDHAP